MFQGDAAPIVAVFQVDVVKKPELSLRMPRWRIKGNVLIHVMNSVGKE